MNLIRNTDTLKNLVTKECFTTRSFVRDMYSFCSCNKFVAITGCSVSIFSKHLFYYLFFSFHIIIGFFNLRKHNVFKQDKSHTIINIHYDIRGSLPSQKMLEVDYISTNLQVLQQSLPDHDTHTK